MKAIPQLHDGIMYRSRTEARWAEFFTLAGLPFEYEAEGYDLDGEWYVPDFRLWRGLHVEVKGAPPTEREHRVARLLAASTGAPVVIASGNPGASIMLAYGVAKIEPSPCSIVEEYRSEYGAWVAEFADGGGWAIPMRDGLVNCAAVGREHPLLAEAGRLQFSVPAPVPDTRGVHRLGDVAHGIVARLARGRHA